MQLRAELEGTGPAEIRTYLKQHHLYAGSGGCRGGPGGCAGHAGLPNLWKLHESHPDRGRYRSRCEGKRSGAGRSGGFLL